MIMTQSFSPTILRLAARASILAIAVPLAATPAAAQRAPAAAPLSIPAMPLADALQRIQAQTGITVTYDPDAIHDLISTPVADARDAPAAVRQAVRGTALVVHTDKSGIVVTSDILVVAQRDEAETSLLVRDATTSTRTGQSLRDQPRSVQVISSKLIAEQQAQTITDALRNAGGVSINTATVQGGVGYSVRGFGAGGIVNGLPAASNSGVAAGTTQPIANVERVEVLKGPDALLAGANSLGGTVNIVTKKPDAEARLYVAAETGSWSQARITIDANNALNDSRTVSARVIASAATADRNFGGYRGNEDYLFAPSLRFKDARTDVVVGVSLGNQLFGMTPFLPLNFATNKPYDVAIGRPLTKVEDQGIQIKTTRFYGEATRKFGDWLTLVARAQHEKLNLTIKQYSPYAVLDDAGTLLIGDGQSQQKGTADAVDAYARINVDTFGIDHTLTAGYTYTNNDTTSYSSYFGGMFPYNFLTETAPPPPQAPIDSTDYLLTSTQNGYYAQYLAKFWKLSLLAGVRHNVFQSRLNNYYSRTTSTERGTSTTPSFGAVFDVTDDLAVYGSLAYGYTPVFTLDRNRNKLPDTTSRNIEGGVKLDLFGDKVLVNASWFKLRQSNMIITDPTDFRYQIAIPGQQGTGIDLNVSGEILPGWQVQGSYTRTKYEYLTFSQFGNVVVGQPKDQYSLYSSYRRKLNGDVTAGLGAGLFGRSSASVDTTGSYRVPAALQVDLNSFLTIAGFDVNLGVRNLFDRRNYGITYSSTYIPIAETRNWRLTVGYRFK